MKTRIVIELDERVVGGHAWRARLEADDKPVNVCTVSTNTPTGALDALLGEIAVEAALESETSDVRARREQRGVDFPCERCKELGGSVLQEGWYRCLRCGYPGK